MSVLKTPIVNLKQIDTSTREGRLLFAAVCSLKRVWPKDDEEILEFLNAKAQKIFEHDNAVGHINERSTGAKLETTVRGVDETRETGNPDLGDDVQGLSPNLQ